MIKIALVLICLLTLASIWRGFKSKFYRKYYKMCVVLLLGGIVCLYIGEKYATVDSNGILHEVGPILPLGAVLLLIGVVGMSILTILLLCRQCTILIKTERHIRRH